MATRNEPVETLLTQLQRVTRIVPRADDTYPMSFRLPPDLVGNASKRTLSVTRDAVEAMDRVANALLDDLRFEYIDNVKDTLRDFIARAWADRKTDQVKQYVANYAREPQDLICFIPIEHLKIEATTSLLGLRLLPVTAPSVPNTLELAPPVGGVAAIPAMGTNLGKMAGRARNLLAHALRVARVGLREHNAVNDRQLRFRPGTAYAFSNELSGWKSRGDIAYDLTLGPSILDGIDERPVWKMPAVPGTDIDKKADLALRWMERARFAGEPLIALLYLFFALEALLGDKSEGLKADALAFRQLVLRHVVTGGFRHPNDTWFLYDRVRSAAVHGEEAPPVDDDAVQNFEWAVRDTLNEYLTFAAAKGISKRGRLINALTSHPDVPRLADWIRTNAGTDWETYLRKVLPPASKPN